MLEALIVCLALLAFLSSYRSYKIGRKEGWDLACKHMEKELLEGLPDNLKKELGGDLHE